MASPSIIPGIIDVTIASTATDSDVVFLEGRVLSGIYIPSTFDGTVITIKASYDDSFTPVTMIDSTGADITKTVAAGKYLPLNPQDFAGVSKIQIVATTTQTTTDTVFKLAVRSIT